MTRYREPEGADYCAEVAHDYDAEGVCGRCGVPARCDAPGGCRRNATGFVADLDDWRCERHEGPPAPGPIRLEGMSW